MEFPQVMEISACQTGREGRLSAGGAINPLSWKRRMLTAPETGEGGSVLDPYSRPTSLGLLDSRMLLAPKQLESSYLNQVPIAQFMYRLSIFHVHPKAM